MERINVLIEKDQANFLRRHKIQFSESVRFGLDRFIEHYKKEASKPEVVAEMIRLHEEKIAAIKRGDHVA